ncbi:hypothetical protein [Nostoc sp. 'Peltigera membranacea cyanobiont' N6]|uniref:hypothetical protein n=1 Tax=Nostoc sp. 'Peltigera membranacea cyanobiont' N6 TaxID=1261031 RepID=UPI0015E454CB|nr:hypothetical protein [Nostoc sp. 'Peltigera membranacea cyanobiont' N6]
MHGKDLGDWSELGILGVLSLLQQEFYRGRLLPGLAAVGQAEGEMSCGGEGWTVGFN